MTESEILENENLVKVDPGLRLDHVVGQPTAVAQLRDLCRRIQWPQIYSALGVSKPKAIALVGPPGAGKTFTIRALANEVSCPLMELKYEDVASHLYDEAIKKLNSFKDQAAKAAEAHGHVLVMIDEADIFFQSRFDSNVHNSDSKKTNFFLRWIDGDLEGSDNFTIVVASNAWETIDPALRRSGRFTKIEFKALSPVDVVEAIKVHMDLSEKRVGRRLFDRTGIEGLVDIAAEVTGADVKELIDSVLLNRANKHLDLLLDGREDITIVDVGPITIDEVADEMKMQHKKLKPAVRRMCFER